MGKNILAVVNKIKYNFAENHMKRNRRWKIFLLYFQTKNTLEFLRGIGSDTVMTPFLVNFKTGDVLNDNIEKCNKLNVEIHRRLSLVNTRQNNKRKPLSVLRSAMSNDTNPIVYAYVKDMLGVRIIYSLRKNQTKLYT